MANQDSCKGFKVLVVDDIPPNLKLIEKYFDILGCEGAYAGSGQEAIEMMKNNQYDLILMDIQMPDMDGIQTTSLIRSEIDSKIPVIALSGSATEEKLQSALSLGMNHYCMKPISINDLEKTLLKFLKPEK